MTKKASTRGGCSPFAVDVGGAYSNTITQVSALETLLNKLPMFGSPETGELVRKPRQPPRKIKKLRSDQQIDLVAAYCDGATIYELGDRFGIDRKTVSRILHRHKVPIRRQGLSPSQVAEASRLREAGWTLKRIADRFDASARTVARRLGDHPLRGTSTPGATTPPLDGRAHR